VSNAASVQSPRADLSRGAPRLVHACPCGRDEAISLRFVGVAAELVLLCDDLTPIQVEKLDSALCELHDALDPPVQPERAGVPVPEPSEHEIALAFVRDFHDIVLDIQDKLKRARPGQRPGVIGAYVPGLKAAAGFLEAAVMRRAKA